MEQNLTDVDPRHDHPEVELRQASVLAVFGFATVTAASRHYRARWERDHPEEPLHWDALLHGLHADMNFSLPEPFEIDEPDSAYVTGPDLTHLPIGWAITARTTFQAMDLHLEIYTKANVTAWRAQGNGGYPWPPTALTSTTTAGRTSPNTTGDH